MLSTKKNNMKGLIIKISVIIVLNIVFKSSIYAQDVLSLKKDLNDHYCTACKNRSERHAYYKQKIKNALAENNQKSVAYYLFFQGKNYAEFGKFDSTLYNFKKSTRLAKELKDEYFLLEKYYFSANLYGALDNNDLKDIYVDSSITIASAGDRSRGMFSGYGLIGLANLDGFSATWTGDWILTGSFKFK